MDNTLTIQVTDQKVLGLLQELEQLHLIKVLKRSITPKTKLSEKYRGSISKQKAAELNKHIKEMRGEWEAI